MKIVVIIIAIIIFFWLLSFLKGFFIQSSDAGKTRGELAGLGAQGIKPTYSNADYRSMSDDLERALKGDSWNNTNETRVYEIFGMLKNDADFIKLKSAFGIRRNQTLDEMVDDEMWDSEIERINSILSANGVTKKIQF